MYSDEKWSFIGNIIIITYIGFIWQAFFSVWMQLLEI
jgi:hypothetical protein